MQVGFPAEDETNILPFLLDMLHLKAGIGAE